jgi:arylsulfatase A-like enzyme
MTRRDRALHCLVGAAGLLAGCGGEQPAERPNVILIVVDTLRADHLGCYGYSRETSPGIDAFAADAMLFERGFSHAADTRYACASLLSGFLPHETGVLEDTALSDDIDTLPEMLRGAGYATAAVISNYVLRAGRGYEQGFDVYDDTMDQREQVRDWPERVATATTDRAIELLDDLGQRPFFLWLHYQDPHGPYASPPGWEAGLHDTTERRQAVQPSGSLSGRGGIPGYQLLGDERDPDFYRARYDAEVRYVDAELVRFFEALKASGAYDDSLIILTADHGEGMGEHDYYFAHGEYLYQHQIHVPLIMRWGDRLRGRRSEPVQHVDIVPTVLAAAGVAAAPSFPGADLRQPVPSARSILSEMQSPLVPDRQKLSLVQGHEKLIHTPSTRQFELYDLAVDPYERLDLFGDATRATRLAELQTEMQAMRARDRLQLADRTRLPGPTDEEREKLRSLGYVE